MLSLAYGFLVGVILGVYVAIPATYLTFYWVFLFFTVLVGSALIWFQSETFSNSDIVILSLIFLVAFGAGWGRYSMIQVGSAQNHIQNFVGDSFEDRKVVEATVVASPQVYRDKVRLRVTPHRVWTSEQMNQAVEIDGGDLWVQVRPYQDLSVSFEQLSRNSIYGDRIRITGSIMEPTDRSNPHGFDFRRFLHNQGIFGAVWFAQNLEKVESGVGNPVVSWSLNLQEELLQIIKMTMPYPQSAFLGGVTLGLRNGLEYTLTPFEEMGRKITYEFRSAGTIHVLAVSGLHVTVIAGALWALFAGIRIPPKIYAPMIVASLLIFTIITGARPATMRAAIMMGLIILIYAYMGGGLKNSVLVGLALAAVLILLYNPKLVFEPSFTLSFLAVLSLALITGPIDRILQKMRGLTFIFFWLCWGVTTAFCIYSWNLFWTWYVLIPYSILWFVLFRYSVGVDRKYTIAGGLGFLDIPPGVRNFIAAQFAIQLGMMYPLSSYYFGEFPFAGMYANLVAIPLVGVVVPLGLFAGLIGLLPVVGPWIALILNAGNYLPVQLFLWISHVFSEAFPYPAVRQLTQMELLLWYLGVAMVVWWSQFYHWFKEAWFWLVDNVFRRSIMTPRNAAYGLVGILVSIVFLSSFFTSSAPDRLTVTVLDVGYGSAIAVQTPQGGNILVNGGTRQWDWHNRDHLADRWDQGRKTVAPFFTKQQIKTLDMVAAQSVEPQRTGGLGYVARQFSIGKVLGPIPRDQFTPLNIENFVQALHDEYYRGQMDRSWFQNDYYGNWKRFWQPLKARSVTYRAPTRGEIVYQENYGSKQFRIYVLNPPEHRSFSRFNAQNQSLVLRLEYGDVSFLLPGDVRNHAQDELASLESRFINHDVMLVPSHGMENSSYNPNFLQAVKPEFIVFSTGDVEIKGPLGKEMEKRRDDNWKKYRSQYQSRQLYRTDRHQAVIFKTDGQSIESRTFAERTASQDESGQNVERWF